MPNTESSDPRFTDIDEWPTKRAIDAMLDGQMQAIASISNQTAGIADAAQAAADKLTLGGRLVYVGAGTSGRVAVQDGVELGPTFGWPADRLVYVMAGGFNALVQSAEGAEDDAAGAQQLIYQHGINTNDVVIGVAASGRTPFTIAAIEAARASGALTIAVANNQDTPLLLAAEHPLLAATGSEAIAGSTRMKAGTAQKVILNLLSTAIMLRLGRVYHGLMVDMIISNDKLLNRAHKIVSSLTQCTEATAIDAVHRAGHDIKIAVLIVLGQTPKAAADLLRSQNCNLRNAINALEKG